MLPLKDIDRMEECTIEGIPCCSISGCSAMSDGVYVTLEGRQLPMCVEHHEQIAGHILW